MYVIDTNFYTRAFVDPAFGPEFRSFYRPAIRQLRVSAVVLFEILAGATDARREREYEQAVLGPFGPRGRLLVPTASTWRLVAGADRALRTRGGYTGSLAQRSFLNDMLIAASCREVGATLVTANARDFAIIRRVIAFRYVTALPAS